VPTHMPVRVLEYRQKSAASVIIVSQAAVREPTHRENTAHFHPAVPV